MKIWISPYSLTAKVSLNRQQSKKESQGFLIKIQSQDYRAGYADCHPWPLFGDADVNQHIQWLKQRKLSPLLKRSVFFAHLDGQAREEKKSLWSSSFSLRSHYTLTEIQQLKDRELMAKIQEQGYRSVKIKVGRNIKAEAQLCNQMAENNSFRWRLDFNGHGGEEFFHQVSPLFLKQLDFCEDPCAYQEKVWRSLEQRYGVPCLVDQPEMGQSQLWFRRRRVIKPARQNFLARRGDVVTNSMDHALGQSFAALQALVSVERLGEQTIDFGLKTDHLFENDPYLSRLKTSDCFFRPDHQTGIGFDDLLEKETWIPL